MNDAPRSDAINAAIADLALPASYRGIIDEYWRPLAKRIVAQKRPEKPLIVGVNGAQGSGKSTLCRFLEVLLAEAGLKAVTLSIDDIYLPKAERADLAKTVHPLFATRGVPGTHDAALGLKIINDLLAGHSVSIPIFDKGADDRSAQMRLVEDRVDIVLFEGWCVGAVPQSEEALAQPVNALEANEDADGIWRRTVNNHLSQDYGLLFCTLDLLIMLQISDFSVVHANRTLQERKLAEKSPNSPALMNGEQVTRFCAHYERLTRHILTDMPKWADFVIPIDSAQSPIALKPKYTGTPL